MIFPNVSRGIIRISVYRAARGDIADLIGR